MASASPPGAAAASSDEAGPVLRGVALPRTACVMTSPEGVDVVLLGTAHISKKSVDEARELVTRLRPDGVFVELCSKRKGILNMQPDQPLPDQQISLEHVQQTLRSGGGAAGLMGLCIASLTASLSKKINMDSFPGAEFAVAAQEVTKQGGVVMLGDREVDVTFQRVWAPLSSWQRCKFIFSLLRSFGEDMSVEELEKMKDTDVLTAAIHELSKEFPSIVEPLIYERDRILTFNLRRSCVVLAQRQRQQQLKQQLQQQQHQQQHQDGQQQQQQQQLQKSPVTLVAIVGMGHVAGMKKLFTQDQDEEDIRRINSLPPPPPPRTWLQTAVTVSVPLALTIAGVALFRRLRR